ncbi:hypothetical protein MKK65_22500 [Methylobacterium sp. J-001]|uniref:hypothetical protein n=1 Tax=Methylobacterium sp. J-001 TaxID=2836609 RepID=UPI001FB924EC|nr:hypothetical protein [Methylobacterium sp. J-001]MCJ2119306.1 hypothetical protein [Methylobacterium sp. J-001]
MGLITQWNIAEQRIKRAEQVRGNEIVAAAIFELRYAGRKIIDSIEIVLNFDIANDTEKRSRVANYLADATEDCVKSKHDAIDAMLNFVTSWFDELEKKVGPKRLHETFPDYLEVLGLISGIQEQIAESRSDRNKLRDAIYNRIDGDDYERILKLFVIMKSSSERVALIARKERQKENTDRNWKLTMLLVALSGWATLLINQYRNNSFPFTVEQEAPYNSGQRSINPSKSGPL